MCPNYPEFVVDSSASDASSWKSERFVFRALMTFPGKALVGLIMDLGHKSEELSASSVLWVGFKAEKL
jgi:hypothetical protein